MSAIRIFLLLCTATVLSLYTGCKDDENSNDNPPQETVPAGMVRIPAANQVFQMGSANGPSEEQPVHAVTLTHDFYLDSTEVTQSDYSSLMSSAYAGYADPTWNSSYGVGARVPAYNVLWGDAALYCNARSRRDGLDSVYSYSAIQGTPGNGSELENVNADLTKNGYRLPTEAEWEFACRGGIQNDFFWNKSYDPYPATSADSVEVGTYAVWTANSFDLGGGASGYGCNVVATKAPNPYRLYDIVGNVYEWCHDGLRTYTSSAVSDPVAPLAGNSSALRGGSWGGHATHLRSANRTFSVPDYAYYFIGFRVAKTAQ